MEKEDFNYVEITFLPQKKVETDKIKIEISKDFRRYLSRVIVDQDSDVSYTDICGNHRIRELLKSFVISSYQEFQFLFDVNLIASLSMEIPGSLADFYKLSKRLQSCEFTTLLSEIANFERQSLKINIKLDVDFKK